jgi:hypothetical protein
VIRITETIRHGEYYNQRRSADIELSLSAFVAFLKGSPYTGPAVTADNQYVRKAFQDLQITGKGQFGWSDYTREDI